MKATKKWKSKWNLKKKWLQISQAFLHYFNAMVSQTLHGELEKKKKARVVEFTCLKARIKAPI